MMFRRKDIPYLEIGCVTKKRFFFSVSSMFILTLYACSQISVGTQLPSASPTSLSLSTADTPSVSSESTPTVLPTNTSAADNGILSETEIPPAIVEPLVTANGLRFDSWSPDSTWIAYWFGENNNELSASLGFVNVLSSEICQPEEVVAKNLESGTVIWQNDNRAIVIPGLKGGALVGVPCEGFAPMENGSLYEIKGEVSPDGHYRAVMAFTSEDQLIHNTVTITDTTTNETILTFLWDTSVHAVRSGPSWLTNDLYLIGQTYQQGVLYLSVPDGQTGNVLTDLMGIETYDEGTVWWVFSQADPATGQYHILLQWWGGPTEWPPLLLYHGEMGMVEELPFYKTRSFGTTIFSSGFSPDGHWLLTGNPVEGGNPAEDSGQDYWLRLLDPPDGSFVQLVNRAGLERLSPNGQTIVFLHTTSSIQLVSFPDGQFLNQWQTPGYEVDRLWWSPDSSRLVAWGFNLESGQHALFVIQP